MYFVLLSFDIVASSSWRCAFTRSGGVSASHCAPAQGQLRDKYRSHKVTHLVKTDILEAVGVEDLEVVQGAVPDVLDVVPERSRNEADVARLVVEGACVALGREERHAALAGPVRVARTSARA